MCPIAQVMEVVKANHNGEDWNAVERVLLNRFGQDTEREEGVEQCLVGV
jgi:hypothetical protein